MGTKIYRLMRPRTFETEFLVCTNKPSSPWFFTPWNIGRSLGDSVPQPVVYFGDHNLEPEDLQLTNGIQFLASERLVTILRKWHANFEEYKSEIVFPSGQKRSDYYSLNFLDVFPVVERKLSIFEPDPDFPDTKIYEIRDLVIEKDALPAVPIFLMGENLSYILVSEDLADELKRQEISGISFQKMAVS